MLDDHLLPIVGGHYYECVGHLEVQEMVSRLLMKKKPNGKAYSVESVKDWFRVFRNMTRDAISHLNLDRDPTLRISFGDQVQDEAKETATIADCLSLLEAMKQKRPGSYALLMTSLHTGQRFCHVSALKWDDVDFDNGLVRFRRKQIRGYVGPISKKKPTPQVVPLTAELLETLRAHRARMEKLGYTVGDDAWLFPTRNGKLKQPSSLTSAIKSSASEAGITVRVTPHTMRYMVNDALRLAHVDKITRKAMVGHVTDDMTEHYSTVQLEEKREAIEAAAVKLMGTGKGDRGYDRGYQPEKKKAA